MQKFPSNCVDSIPLPLVNYKYIENSYLSIFETNIAPTTYATQSMVYHMNHKIGRYRHTKQYECFWSFKRYEGLCSERSNFLNQRCAMLNYTHNAISIVVPATFYFFVGQEITFASSSQNHQGNQA